MFYVILRIFWWLFKFLHSFVLCYKPYSWPYSCHCNGLMMFQIIAEDNWNILLQNTEISKGHKMLKKQLSTSCYWTNTFSAVTVSFGWFMWELICIPNSNFISIKWKLLRPCLSDWKHLNPLFLKRNYFACSNIERHIKKNNGELSTRITPIISDSEFGI